VSTTIPRPFGKRLLHFVRRVHLYLGLFLFPWAVLYGVTAFLFNHPTLFTDQPTVNFGREAIAGTPLESVPSLREQAEAVIAALNAEQKPTIPYGLGAGEIKYNREFAFGTVKGEGKSMSVLIDPKTGSGTLRTTFDKPKDELPKAPFSAGQAPSGSKSGRGEGTQTPDRNRNGIVVENNLHRRVEASIAAILERTGHDGGEITVTSVPDLVFPIEADGQIWIATYNATTGCVTGKPVGSEEKNEISVRRFLTRLHLAHGYPGEVNARWSWAVFVDAMAFVMCFWGISGLFMWWQIRATRRIGAIVLVLSAIAATALGVAMYAAMLQS